MRGTIRCVVIAGLLGGCPSDDTNVRDDAPIEESGLAVVWSSDPSSWPSDLGSGVTLESAVFAIDNLRVIGDAGPGDPRTTKTTFAVRWDENGQPVEIVFDEAPPGLYSQLSIVIDGHLATDSIEIRGHAFVNNDTWEYRIEEQNMLGFTVPIDKMLSPGRATRIGLRVNFRHALDAIDFSTLRVDDGHLTLESTDTQMPAFRQKLVESFEIDSSGNG